MTSVTALPRGRPLTRDDLAVLAAERDDGHRYELLDGVLLVSPAPRPLHQRAVGRVYQVLSAVCPPECEVLVAPLDVVLAEDSVLSPDVLVARRADVGERDLRAPPMLVVEVLSPSTRRIDVLLKRSGFEAAGTPAYWVVDIDEPAVKVWLLREGAYTEVGRVRGDEALTLAEPFPVTVVPRALVSAY